MMKLKNSKLIKLLLFSLLFFMQGCGKTGETTKAKLTFDTNFLNVTDSLGGVYFFGKNEDTKEDFAFTDDSVPSELELTNGKWTFLAVAWDGLSNSSKKMEGVMKCAKVVSQLNGTEASISMQLAAINCRDDAFGPGLSRDSNKDLRESKFYKCGDDILNCANSTAQSMKLVLRQKSLDGKIIDGLSSRCITDATISTSVIDGTYNFKSFINMIPTAYRKAKIEYFSDPSCSNLDYTFEFSAALQTSSTVVDPSANWTIVNDGVNAKIFTIVPICKTQAGNLPTPHNTGTNNIICNKDQFTYMNSNLALDYKFLSDINLEGNSYTTPLVTGLLSGNIDGNGHKIFNASFDFSGESNYSGIFSSYNSSTIEKVIKNLRVEDISFISPNSYPAGALFGSITGRVQIKELSSNNINITANSGNSVGSIIGTYWPTTTLTNFDGWMAKASNVTINANGCTNLGGVIGNFDTSSASSLTDMHGLYAENIYMDIADCQKVGGVLGTIKFKATLSKVTGKNIKIENSNAASISSYNNSIGGLIGFDFSGLFNRTLNEALITDSHIGTFPNPLKKVTGVGSILGQDNSGLGVIANAVSKNVKIHANSDGGSGPTPLGIGGIAGKARAKLIDVKFDGEIHTDISDAAGIIGGKYTQGISNAKSFGSISCRNNCGGIIGKSYNESVDILENLFSKMNIISTGVSVGGIFGYLLEDDAYNIEKLAFEGYVEGANEYGCIGGRYDSSSGSFDNIYSLYTNCKIKSGTDAVLGISKIHSTGSSSTLLMQGAYFLGIDESDNKIEFVNKTLSGGSVLQFSIGCMINESSYTATTYTTSQCGQYTDMTADPQNLVSLTSGIYKLDATNKLRLTKYLNESQIGGVDKLGTIIDPYLISTKVQWNNIKDSPYFMNKTFVLTSSIDFMGATFSPIGSSVSPFSGNFIGNGYALKNINITDNASEALGVFRYLSGGATINDTRIYPPIDNIKHSLTILKPSFSSTLVPAIGALAGKIDDTGGAITIKNVTITGDGNPLTMEINADTAPGIEVGGAIGGALLNQATSNIENIKVQLTNVSAASVGGSSYVGGIFGKFQGYGSIVQKLYYQGSIDGSLMLATGGIFGKIDPQTGTQLFNNLVSLGTINTTPSNSAGGIYGAIAAGTTSIASSRVSMDISSTSSVGCIGGSFTSSISLGHIYAVCNNLTAASTYGLLPTGYSNSGKTLFSFGSSIDATNIQASSSDFKSYSLIQSSLGEAPWPEFVYEADRYPYLPFEKDL